jgi:hypothetical protein
VLARGGDSVRTGLEDNIRITHDRLAAGNAELVQLAVDAVSRHGCRPATPAEARAVLGLATIWRTPHERNRAALTEEAEVGGSSTWKK